MSGLNPKGIMVEIGGEQRELLFTLNVIDEIQDQTGEPVFRVLGKALSGKEQAKTVRYLMTALLNDEAKRKRYFDPHSELKEVTEQDVGWLINSRGMNDSVRAIISAYGISMPDPDEEDDPNLKGGLTS